MPFVAKLRGGYGYASDEGRNNIRMINGFLNQYNLSMGVQAGIIGNIIAESRLNPWMWYGNIPNGAYGLFQFVPGRHYINNCKNLLGYGPSLSTSYPTENASPDDGWAQLLAMIDDVLHKWNDTCWRDYWDKTTYSQLWTLVEDILSTYGGQDFRLSFREFCNIQDPMDATIAFMACYEGPNPPNWRLRVDNANGIWSQLSPDTPPEPPGTRVSYSKFIYKLRPLWWQSNPNIRR